ncbi:PREDICTED: regulator of chromosome condensation-like [Papilio xuthus]|uniref:Regulator of chromosome condensation-like n=1 Tax=Papilio xuthus TaxID=66420 RepID=A0AAJ7EIH5_PAPXU|nr:PREDICTED: regulator of chromosome condensation-like [Papilio xuthus]XP_013178631.1 PREDICTED: regulator of chromosome condensation-like [Papilio xuthus]
MPAARGVKRTASKSSAPASTTGPKNKKKRGAVQLEIPSAAKKRGRVFTCGQGDVGQLGLGEDVVETTKFKYVSALGDKIIDIRAGGMHTVAIDTDGKVWTFGCNDEGALGRITKGDKDEGTPRTVSLPQKAVSISAGDSHTAALLDNGDVYAWGAFRDSHGSMGLVVRGRETKGCQEPIRVDIGETAVGIASGGDHLVILSTSGAVYTMGCGEQGQLGRLSQRSASRDARQGFSALLTPAKVTLKFGASRVWAGCHATFVLDANGDKVFAFGLNNYGQLGITGEKRKTAIFSATECDAFTRLNTTWSAVACGQHHSLAVDGNGQLYAIGRTDYGRLGLGERTEDAEYLEPVPKLQNKKCISIATGISNSFAVTDSGEAFSWGMGSEGQLGTGAAADASEPTPPTSAPFDTRKPIRVSAGGQHTVLLLEETKELSPPPENKEEMETVEETAEEQEPEEEKVEKKRPAKRQKKQEQDEEISSTSTAQSAETKPEKVNGDEQKENVMEVDETDKPDDKKETEEKKPEPEDENETEQTEKAEINQPDTMDTSSQETTDSESKPMDTDVQTDTQNMNTDRQTDKIDHIPSDNALVTSA